MRRVLVALGVVSVVVAGGAFFLVRGGGASRLPRACGVLTAGMAQGLLGANSRSNDDYDEFSTQCRYLGGPNQGSVSLHARRYRKAATGSAERRARWGLARVQGKPYPGLGDEGVLALRESSGLPPSSPGGPVLPQAPLVMLRLGVRAGDVVVIASTGQVAAEKARGFAEEVVRAYLAELDG